MSRARSEVDVLVAGAGPTGLMLASELARHGASVRLIDTPTAHPPISKATAIMPRTLELLDRASASDAFVSAGAKLSGLSLYANKREIFTLTSSDIDSPYPFVLGLEQFRTEDLLAEHAVRLGINIERETTMTSFNAEGDCVSVTVQRTNGTEETIRARYLVGCDGAHSVTRKSLGLPFEGATMTSDHFAVAYLPIEWDLPGDRLFEFHSDAGTVLVTPLPNNLWSIIFELDPTQWTDDGNEGPDLDQIRSVMDARSPVPATLSQPIWTAYYRINHRQVPAYRVGRVFLAGDAAHIHSPAGGQGMNTGMQDALNLGWKLAHVCRGIAPESLLDSYHAERHPVGHDVLKLTTELQDELDQRNRIMMALRDHALQGLNHAGIARRTLARVLGELSYNYRHSPLAHEDRAGSIYFRNEARHPSFVDCHVFAHGPHAGDRAPDLPLGAQQDGLETAERLFDVFRDSPYTLLMFEGTHQTSGSKSPWSRMERVAQQLQDEQAKRIRPIVVSSRRERPSDIEWSGPILLDGDGTLHHRYGARGECLYLVRPDGYIAYRSEPIDPEKLSAYLPRIVRPSVSP